MTVGCSEGFFFCGEFAARPTDSFNETEMFLDSFGAEERFGAVSDESGSMIGVSENPNGILDVSKNKITIRDKTDFNQKLPRYKKLQKFLGVELYLQKFGVDQSLGDWINYTDYL